MRIKHLLLILLFISINLVFIPIYEYGYRIGTWNPNKLDNAFEKLYVTIFTVVNMLYLFGFIYGIVYISIETDFFNKIGKLLNKKIL